MGLGLLERHVDHLLCNIKKPFSYQVRHTTVNSDLKYWFCFSMY